MRTLRFGIEIETIGQTRARVAAAIQSVVGGTVQHVGTPYCYDPYDVIAEDGRRWRVMADSSLSAEKARQAEVVSPILRYEDIETLQEVIRAVRRAGARVDTAAASTSTSTPPASTPRRCATWSRSSTSRSGSSSTPSGSATSAEPAGAAGSTRTSSPRSRRTARAASRR
jgi:hypothetical protein